MMFVWMNDEQTGIQLRRQRWQSKSCKFGRPELACFEQNFLNAVKPFASADIKPLTPVPQIGAAQGINAYEDFALHVRRDERIVVQEHEVLPGVSDLLTKAEFGASRLLIREHIFLRSPAELGSSVPIEGIPEPFCHLPSCGAGVESRKSRTQIAAVLQLGKDFALPFELFEVVARAIQFECLETPLGVQVGIGVHMAAPGSLKVYCRSRQYCNARAA